MNFQATGAETVNLCWHSLEWCVNEWFSHPGDAVCCSVLQLVADTSGRYKETGACGGEKKKKKQTRERRNQIKPLRWATSRGSLSCLREKGGGRNFWEAELRVNSICWKTTTATNYTPSSRSFIEMQSPRRLSSWRRNPDWLKATCIICTITLPQLHV